MAHISVEGPLVIAVLLILAAVITAVCILTTRKKEKKMSTFLYIAAVLLAVVIIALASLIVLSADHHPSATPVPVPQSGTGEDRGRFSVFIHPDAGRTRNRPLSFLITVLCRGDSS
jgi:heme A synthase